jgi:hypothetical protein
MDITHEGKTLTLKQWAKETGINYQTLHYRFNKGWSPSRMLETAPFTGNREATVVERFWSFVAKQERVTSSEVGTPCWLWNGGKRRKGYGQFSIKKEGKNHVAHRYAFFLHHGRFPNGIGRHLCNNPSCVRWSHIAEGTQKDNIQDAVRAGRMASGERNGSAKLTRSQVQRMRQLRERGWTQQRLADKFGVSQPNVSAILADKNWK